MKEDEKTMILIVVLISIFFLGGYGGLVLYSGTDTPFSVVVSQSMQHDNNRSQMDRIDTGDIVLVRDKSNVDLKTYVEGYMEDEIYFGDYGNVVIYRGESGLNILHRLILYIEIYGEGEDKYAVAPYLEQDTHSEKCLMFDVRDGTEFNPSRLTSDFSFTRCDVGYEIILIPIEHILSTTESNTSGYITMGDNNRFTDQSRMFINPLVSYDDIVSVPVLEIPWLGTLKMIMDGNIEVIDIHTPNSIPLLVLASLTGLIMVISAQLQLCLYSLSRNKGRKRS